MQNDNKNERGQVGIGTLIVFIAMVLVAAIAAGVLINTAGFLQSKSEATGQQSSAQVSNRVQVVTSTGHVTGTSGNEQVDLVNVTVKKAPGSGQINLKNTTVTWISDSGTANLVWDSANTSGSAFTVTKFKDASNSSPVIDSSDDRLVINFNASQISGSLDGGDTVTLKITTRSGATTSTTLTVPESLSGKTSVEL